MRSRPDQAGVGVGVAVHNSRKGALLEGGKKRGEGGVGDEREHHLLGPKKFLNDSKIVSNYENAL